MLERNVQVGKYTLESLTTGMYSDPKIIYREYIQNSVDALENAIEENVLEYQSMRIDIIVDEEGSYISIRDNGTGIKKELAVQTLMNIGSSSKRSSNNRGFRGIGRLGGMSYCNTLAFTTSAEGEDIKTEVTFDCKKLRELLVPGSYEDMDMADVLNTVTKVHYKQEKTEKHYFLVEMKEVSGFSDLLNIYSVKSYISQVAPLPYRTKKFIYADELHKYLKDKDYSLEEFPIFVGESPKDLEPVYKPNVHRYHSDRNKKKMDEINKMEYFDVVIDGELYALGWYGNCNWWGSLYEKEISGIRVRKGNILIGDNKTLNGIFRENRFNGWTQGELFIITDKLIPNARRDDFEQNDAYYKLFDALKEGVGAEITKTIRDASHQRNDSSAKVISEITKDVNKAEIALEEGFNSAVDKSRLLDTLNEAKEKLEKAKIKDEFVEKKNELHHKLEKTIDSVNESKNYKINNVNTGIDKKSKKILAVVTDILSQKLSKRLVDDILDEIVTVLNRK